MKNILIVFGTRPEAIKLAPLIIALKNAGARVKVCNTEQQKQLSNQALNYFGLSADICLDAMRKSQQLASTQARIMSALEDVFNKERFDCCIVQGDTLSVLCGALAGFYAGVKIAHIEAGLRSHSLTEPFPEEAIRQMVARIACMHFAPTQQAFDALKLEALSGEIFMVGNTCIDALSLITQQHQAQAASKFKQILNSFNRCVLVTAHRRENTSKDRLSGIISAVSELANLHKDILFIWPLHPNPAVAKLVLANLSSTPNIHLCDALEYPLLVEILRHSEIVLTDSGGLQEEAPSFGLRICVLREQTERPEGVETGFAELVGTQKERIVKAANKMLAQNLRIDAPNPYGDGNSASKITKLILERI